MQLTWLTPPKELEQFLRYVRIKCHVLEETVMLIRMSRKKISQICSAISTSWLVSIDKKRVYDIGEFESRQIEHRANMQAQLRNYFNNIKDTMSAAYQKCAAETNDVRSRWEDFKKKVWLSIRVWLQIYAYAFILLMLCHWHVVCFFQTCVKWWLFCTYRTAANMFINLQCILQVNRYSSRTHFLR